MTRLVTIRIGTISAQDEYVRTNPDGTVSGIAAVVRDETQRWADERELRRQVHEATEVREGGPR